MWESREGASQGFLGQLGGGHQSLLPQPAWLPPLLCRMWRQDLAPELWC